MSTEPIHEPSVALVLQGGGALGAYHIGAYQALAEAGLHPDWVCGISIGAINSAVIAGNKPEDRVARLDALWEAISWPDFRLSADFTALAILHNMASNAEALLLGQPNFFMPRPVNPFFISNAPSEEVSFYDTTPMLFSLKRFADFGLINKKITRLSLGATNIETGQLEFFDNTKTGIGPEHVLASGSLPPGFPAVRVGSNLYWDGGCVSNTPLDAILADLHHPHLIVFVIDLWDASGKPPRNMNDVFWRMKQIQYASRTANQIEATAAKVNLRRTQRALQSARRILAEPDTGAPAEEAGPEVQRLDLIHIIYHPGPDQIPNSDAEFSRTSIAARRAAGYKELKEAIAAAPWLSRGLLPAETGAVVHRVEFGRVTTLSEPRLADPAGWVQKPSIA